MPVLGILEVKRAGTIHRRRVIETSVTGPAADLIVPAGGTADLTVTVDTGMARGAQIIGITSITGLPAGIYIQSISIDAAAKTITITLHNPGAADVTVTANSVTIGVIAIN